MHPLEAGMSDNHNHSSRSGPPARRRTSLDNSSLAAPDSFKQFLMDSEDDDYHEKPLRRRLSLNNHDTTTPTFLAELRPKKAHSTELDLDLHSSSHHGVSYQNGTAVPSLLGGGMAGGGLLGGDDSSECLESDDDSFCDASIQDQADHEYIQTDLGASCFFQGDDASFLRPISKATIPDSITEEED